jgi:hypothetical protein
MTEWIYFSLGALCIVGGFVLAARGIGGAEAASTFRFAGAEIELTKVGPGVIFAALGLLVIFFGLRISPNPDFGDALDSYVGFYYKRIETDREGSFQREGKEWIERVPELQTSRTWIEDKDAAPPGRIRLRDPRDPGDGGPIIDIEPRSNTIFYTDRGFSRYPYPQPLDRIIRTETISGHSTE